MFDILGSMCYSWRHEKTRYSVFVSNCPSRDRLVPSGCGGAFDYGSLSRPIEAAFFPLDQGSGKGFD